MADRAVTVTITARDNFSSVIGKYQQAMGQAGTATKKLGQDSGGLKGGIDQLNSSFNTLFGAGIMGIGLTKVIQLGSEMQQLGAKVNSARSVFDQLTGGVGEAASTLEQLRTATHGTVADLDLMKSANALLLQGLASTNEQAADLTGIAVTLGRAMGEDAGGAVEKFSQLLRNQSIRLLDNFGLSSARVKDRITALMAATEGLSREQAFVQATIEESRLAIGRLGDSAVVAGTATERLGTIIENTYQKASSNVAAGVEGFAYFVTSIIDLANKSQEDAADEAVQQAEDAYTRLSDVWDAMMASRPGEVFNISEVQFFVDALNNLQSGRFTNLEDAADAAARMNGGTRATADQLALIEEISSNIGEATDRRLQVEQEIAKTQQAGYEAAFIASERQFSSDQQRADTLSRQIQAAEESRARITGSMRPRYTSDAMGGLANAQALSSSLGAYNTQSQADQLRAMADEMGRLFELAGQNELVSEGELGRIRDAKDQVESLAAAAQAGADAFANMTLPEAFGQGGGGMQGEINQAVINQMQAAGATPEQIAAFQRTGALASGQETQASLGFSEQIAPLLARAATELGPEVGAALTEAVTNYLQSSALGGETPTTAGMMAALTGAGLELGTGTGSGGRQFNVRPGDTVSGLAAQLGMTQDQIMAAAGITNPRLLQPGTYGANGALGYNFSGGQAGLVGGAQNFTPAPQGAYLPGYAMPYGPTEAAGIASQSQYDQRVAMDQYMRTQRGIGIPSSEQAGGMGGYADYSQMATSTGEISDDYNSIATDAETTSAAISTTLGYAESWRAAQALINSDVQEVTDNLAILTSNVQQVEVSVNLTGDIEMLKALLNGDLEASVGVTADAGGAAKATMAATTRDNYGTPPGVDPRVVGPHGL